MRTLELDSIDWKILSVLQDNARIANVDLADKVNLSPSPCLVTGSGRWSKKALSVATLLS